MTDDDFRLVIINDDTEDGALLRRFLLSGSGRKITFIEARTGEEGIRACRAPGAPRPDCVIVDLHLPDMSGLDVLARLKNDVGDVMFPVVLFIDTGDECKAAAQALKAGAHDYIAKSWMTADGLACAVENAVVRLVMAKRLREQQVALDRRECEFKALVENAPEIIARYDTDFRHIYVNPAVERATGIRAEEFIGKTSRAVGLAADLCELWEAKLREAMDSLREVLVTFDFQAPKGMISYQSRLVPELSPSGAVETILCISTDVTERKRAELALKAADKRKDEFLGILAHELRNPLAAIRSAAHLLKLNAPADPDILWGRDVIERQVKQLTRLIDDLLDVSRINTGKIKLRRARLDVKEVVARAAESIRPLIVSKQHSLEILLPSQPLLVAADPVRLEQVLGNLLANSAKYTDNEGSITLSGAREGPFVVIRVRDTGMGIAPEVLPHVFDLFIQDPRTLDRSQGGLGIGLTLVKTLMEMHGGRVAAASDGLGRGSEFTIWLPALVEDPIPTVQTSQPNAPANDISPRVEPVRILVVDDNADAAQSLAMLLSASGYEVETAGDGPSALAGARRFRPSFVLMDIGMPGMSGYELARTLRRDEDVSNVVLVAVSGFARPRERKKSRAAGFDHHLVKPVDLETLLPILTGTKT